MDQVNGVSDENAYWRQSAPVARGLARLLYAWRKPGWIVLLSCLAAIPFLAASGLASALFSLTSTANILQPISEMRAVFTGAADVRTVEAPAYLMLLFAGDLVADAPGRIHLLAKMFGASSIILPMAYIASMRLPAIQCVFLTAALAAYSTAPFAGVGEFGFAVLSVLCLCFMSAPAKNSNIRNALEGGLGGIGLFCLWMLNPVLSLAGFIGLSLCPFVGGKAGGLRYVFSLCVFLVLGVLCEVVFPGFATARATILMNFLGSSLPAVSEPLLANANVVMGTLLVIFLVIIFGGSLHARSWLSAIGTVVIGFAVSISVGVNAWPVFIVAGAVAAFSTASPFYDGIFRDHDRASVAVACVAALVVMFSCLTLSLQVVGQFKLQHEIAQSSPQNIRKELALAQPGGSTIAQWVQDGRFSTLEARALFSLAPTDQSQVLLSAVKQAQHFANAGADVAILTAADSACVLMKNQPCYADGPTAATNAAIVLSPRLDLDPASVRAKNMVEALLYTEFRLVQQNALWDVWVRRGTDVKPKLIANLGELAGE